MNQAVGLGKNNRTFYPGRCPWAGLRPGLWPENQKLNSQIQAEAQK